MGLGLDPVRSHSPGALAAHLLHRMGLRPPLEQFGLSDEELSHWMRGLHGGWVTSGPLDGMAFPAVDADIPSAYSAVASLIGWWVYMTAEGLAVSDVTKSFRRLLASSDLRERMLQKATWRHWGLTRVLLRVNGEPVPVEVVEHVNPRLVIGPTWWEQTDATWLDAVGATFLADHPVEVLQAVRLAPCGHQSGLRRAAVPGAVLVPEVDPVVTLVRLRRRAKVTGDARMAALIRVLTSSMVYGNPARFDPDRDGERPGPWCFPPLAATVAAGCRCLLAMVECDVRSRGSVLAARDTDGCLFVASPTGGSIETIDGSPTRVLSWDEVRQILAGFDPLDPFGDGEPFWIVETGEIDQPRSAVVWGRKRSAQFIPTEECRIATSTEHVLGANAAPPSLQGHRPDGRQRWTENVAQVHVRLAQAQDRSGVVPPFDWEANDPDFPAFKRVSLSGPSILSQMPRALGLRPFARVVEAESSVVGPTAHPVAPDPGGDLGDWLELSWHDTHTGRPCRITTDPAELGAVLVESLRSKAIDWVRPRPDSLSGGVIVDPLLTRAVGRSSGAFSAGGSQAVHADLDEAEILTEASRSLGVTRVAQLTGLSRRTVGRLSSRPTRPSTLRRAGINLQVRLGSDPLVELVELAAPRLCAYPECASASRLRSQTCSERHRKALARLAQGVRR